MIQIPSDSWLQDIVSAEYVTLVGRDMQVLAIACLILKKALENNTARYVDDTIDNEDDWKAAHLKLTQHEIEIAAKELGYEVSE